MQRVKKGEGRQKKKWICGERKKGEGWEKSGDGKRLGKARAGKRKDSIKASHYEKKCRCMKSRGAW